MSTVLDAVWWAALAWSIAGLTLGALVHVVPAWRGSSWGLTLLVGLLGAWAGGLLATVLGFGGLAGFDLGALAVATAAALLALLLHAWSRARRLVATAPPEPADPLPRRG